MEVKVFKTEKERLAFIRGKYTEMEVTPVKKKAKAKKDGTSK